MPRLRNRFGVVVNVSDETALHLTGFVPADDVDEAPAGNASRDEWAAYADRLGVEYDADAGREAIKSAINDR